MKKEKLGIFVLALTLSVGISSGVYACEQNKDKNTVKPTALAQKLDFKNSKTEQWNAKFIKNHKDEKDHSDKKRVNKNHKDCKEKNENKCDEIKPVISVEDKAALKAKKAKIKTVKDANKVLKTEIIKNAEAVKIELKRIEDSKIVLDPIVKTEADSALLAVKDATTKKNFVKPVVTTVTPVLQGSEVVATVVPVVDPTVPVVPADRTYLEKLNERLDRVFKKYTEKNTELTTLGTRILNILNALTLIK